MEQAAPAHGDPLIAGVELGGTKCIVALARGRTVLREQRFATGGPEMLALLSDRLAEWARDLPFAALGIASFGPIVLDRTRPDFGHMANTPKPGWAGTDIYGHFAARFPVPVALDTDVAGSALAEGQWGASIGCNVHIYATIGTGVGIGVVVDGKPVHGLLHPEAGHIRVRRIAGDNFTGRCPSHGDCIEGLVAGPGLIARAPAPLADVADDDPLWDHVATDLAEWMAMLILTLSPRRVVLGGGVPLQRPALIPKIRAGTAAVLNGYLAGHTVRDMETLIVAPALGANAGPLGAIALGMNALA